MTSIPSGPIPETAQRRAAIARDIQAATGLDEAVLERLVRTFYEAARRDEIIGHLFDGVHDWDKHIARITTFWSSVALLTGRYHGQPLPVHFPLGLEPSHFARWLDLFEKTVHEVCTPAAAELLMDKARRIARSRGAWRASVPGRCPRMSRAEASFMIETLLRLAFRHRITAPDAEAGIDQLSSRADGTATPEAWRAAVADALTAGYIHDPVRLPAGALQCPWHLELTPAGVEAARRLRPDTGVG